MVFDSRDAAPGALFVAFPGESADGHDFAGPPSTKAPWPSWPRRTPPTASPGRPGSVPTVTVDDGDLLRALSALAAAHLAGCPGPRSSA